MFPGFGAFISIRMANCRHAAMYSEVSMLEVFGIEVRLGFCGKVLLVLC